jgi:hypothetical protein
MVSTIQIFLRDWLKNRGQNINTKANGVNSLHSADKNLHKFYNVWRNAVLTVT